MVQTHLSKERTPTLCYSIPEFEKFIDLWEKMAKKMPRLKPFIEIGLDKAYEYYDKMDRTNAYLVAMGMVNILSRNCSHTVALNPSLRFSQIKVEWKTESYKKAVAEVKKVVS